MIGVILRNRFHDDHHPNACMSGNKQNSWRSQWARLVRSSFPFLLSAFFCSTVSAQESTAASGTPAPFGSIQTPRPINPAASTTNPGARATQITNPFLGSVPAAALPSGDIEVTLASALDLGLRYNLGIIDSKQADSVAKAQRQRALAALLPQISARAQETFEQLSYKELGLRLPAAAGFQLPPTSGAFG